MRQVFVSDGAMAVGDAAVPVPRAGEVLIRVMAAGVNRPDVLQRKGAYPPPADASPVLGLEVAGEVAAIGDGVSGLAIGDRVCALVNGGGYAAFCVAPAGQCLRWPDGMDAVQAAALPETFFTVWVNLFSPSFRNSARVVAGESLLVHGGTSGIGTTAIQLGRALGARVFATAGSAAKCAACLELGAAGAIDYRSEDFVARTRELTGGRGVDAVLDMVAGSYLHRNVQVLAPEGRLVVIAVQGGMFDPEFNIALMMMKRVIVTGSTLRPRSVADKAVIATELLREVWPLLDKGVCRPVVHAVFGLEDVGAAHRMMEDGAHIGKIVLRVAA